MRLSLSEALRVQMQARASGDGLLALLTLTHDAFTAPDPPDYSVSAALAAAAADTAAYFDQTIPGSTAAFGPFVPPVPTPPSQRGGWTAQAVLPGITAADHGLLGPQVITSGRFPLEGGVFVNQHNRVRIAAGPDGTPGCIEHRCFTGTAPSVSDFHIRTFNAAPKEWAGLSAEVWWQDDFDFGDPATNQTGGKVGVGLYVGSRFPAGGGAAPETQAGVMLRNIWGNGTAANPNRYDALTQLYSYSFGRRVARDGTGDMYGRKIGQNTKTGPRWARGRWVPVEYEVLVNRAGYADGLVRYWVDGQLVGEESDAILRLDGSWGVSGAAFSDAWNDGLPPKNQSSWVRNVRYHLPPSGTDPRQPTVTSTGTRLRYVRNGTPVTSRGLQFEPYPFDLILPDQEQGVPPTAKLEINNIGRDVIGLLREARGRIYCTIEIVKISDHDYVELAFPRFVLSRPRTQGAATITADLALPDLSNQRYPKDRFVEAYYPALARAS